MSRDISLYLSDIIESIDDVTGFTKDMDYEDFLNDKKTIHAVMNCIEIIGEASKNVPAEIQQKKPDIPWKDMARMRDKCIHFYFGVDYTILWDTVKKNLPPLRTLVQILLNDLRG